MRVERAIDHRRARWLCENVNPPIGAEWLTEEEYRRRWLEFEPKFISAEVLVRFGADPACSAFQRYVEVFGLGRVEPSRENFERASAEGIWLGDLVELLDETPDCAYFTVFGKQYQRGNYSDRQIFEILVAAFRPKPRERVTTAGAARIRDLEEKIEKLSIAHDEKVTEAHGLSAKVRGLEDDLEKWKNRAGACRLSAEQRQAEVDREKENVRRLERDLASAERRADRAEEKVRKISNNHNDTANKLREARFRIRDFERGRGSEAAENEIVRLRAVIDRRDERIRELENGSEIEELARRFLSELEKGFSEAWTTAKRDLGLEATPGDGKCGSTWGQTTLNGVR